MTARSTRCPSSWGELPLSHGVRWRVRQEEGALSPPAPFSLSLAHAHSLIMTCSQYVPLTTSHLNSHPFTHRTSWGKGGPKQSPAAEDRLRTSSSPDGGPPGQPKGVLKQRSRYEGLSKDGVSQDGLSLSEPLSLDSEFMPRPNRDAVIQGRQARREGHQRSRSVDEVSSPRQSSADPYADAARYEQRQTTGSFDGGDPYADSVRYTPHQQNIINQARGLDAENDVGAGGAGMLKRPTPPGARQQPQLVGYG